VRDNEHGNKGDSGNAGAGNGSGDPHTDGFNVRSSSNSYGSGSGGASVGDSDRDGGTGGSDSGSSDGLSVGGTVEHRDAGREDSGIGSGNSDAAVPRRKRGRPRKQRDGNGVSDSGPSASSEQGSAEGEAGSTTPDIPGRVKTPRDISPRETRGGRKSSKKALDQTLSKANDLLFSLVAHATGVPTWSLAPVEADMMGEAFADAARALPSKKFKAVETILGQIMPWVGLVGTLSVIVYPRIQAHRYEMARRRHLRTMPDVTASQTSSERAATGNGRAGDEYASTSGVTGTPAIDIFHGSEGDGGGGYDGDSSGLGGRIPVS
jgi:hypothetical protein